MDPGWLSNKLKPTVAARGCEQTNGRPLGSSALLIPCCVAMGKSSTLSEPPAPPALVVGIPQNLGEEGKTPVEGWLVV